MQRCRVAGRGWSLEQVARIASLFIRWKHSNESLAKQDAFVSAVTFAVTGWRPSLGKGPTVREWAAARVCRPYWDVRSAIAVLVAEDGPIFGPITDIHRQCWAEEDCLDDDPRDVRELSGQG
ncbi:MAG: hypothetical protein IPK84_03135 [Candidatus Moraniibacteriota bacterium]|nr:MAG: hypothetical protein IPK84_03135 [Candidatus Moranbacteria bacterium]